jgi:hydroxymethylpyrimidine/phosphomethylpyrimidine kinase
MTIARILVIAGSDSGGGAGIQADIKTITMLGGHAMTAITAITAQNTLGVRAISHVPAELVSQQIAAVIDDIGIDAIKLGMLANVDIVQAVATSLLLATRNAAAAAAPVVLDPVMMAKGGARLIAEDAIAAVKARLLPGAALVTPNAPELSLLTGMAVTSVLSAGEAAMALAAEHGCTVLAKGGHLPGERVVDLLVGADGILARWEDPRIDSRHTHGTGCTLASAIATGLGAGLALEEAITRARAYVRRAIEAAPGLGAGHGPMGHGAAGMG